MPISRAPRFLVAPGSLGETVVRLPAEEVRHLRVQRLGSGDTIVLCDGVGVERVGEIDHVDADGVTVRLVGDLVEGFVEREPALRCVLVQGIPVKLQRMDTIVRQATEVGVAAVLPVVAARSQDPSGGRAVLERRAERWRRIARSAAKQCGRTRVPLVSTPVEFAAIPWDEIPGFRLLMEPADAVPGVLGTVLAESVPQGGIAVLVGPEGGWSEAERAETRERGARAVRLGPRILRADTAGVAALVAVLHAWGDLD